MLAGGVAFAQDIPEDMPISGDHDFITWLMSPMDATMLTLIVALNRELEGRYPEAGATTSASTRTRSRLGTARSSSRVAKGSASALAGQLDVARACGVGFTTIAHPGDEGRTRTCYDGEAWRRVLKLGGTPDALARAALGHRAPLHQGAERLRASMTRGSVVDSPRTERNAL